ncbi:amino acid adenylation domain-containing protein [Actinosynnema sp. NPDC020468]|uniref:amino acid adenylation domain-containing protein n=1 Tax=Actinosynnema sp. NPDC020468 TaxID=3154488 RepID=UPI0033D8314D
MTGLGIEEMRDDVAALLGVAREGVPDTADLARLGLDSIGVMRLAGRWRHAGARAADLLERRTLAEWHGVLGGPVAPVEVPEVDPGAPFDPAPMQHAYWVGRADGHPLGGVGAHFYAEFDGRGVRPDRLVAAVREVVARHGMLRVRFTTDGRAVISPEVRPPVEVREVSDVDTELPMLRREMSARRMDVEAGEVFRVVLSLLPGGATRLHVAVEMLAADAHSFRVLLADLADAYLGRAAEPISLTYQGYLAARAATPDPAREADRRYWAGRLADLPGPPALPLALDPARLSGHRAERRHRLLSLDDRAVLAARAAEHGVTLPVVLATAFADVLAAWSGTRRLLLCLPRYDRVPLHRDVDRLVGDFTDLLLLDVDTGPATFAARARGVDERLRADLAHGAWSGLDVLRELSRLRGGPVGAPVVFTSALSLGELFGPPVRACFGEPGWTTSQTPQVWLDCQAVELADGVGLNWDAAEGLFPAGVLDAMSTAYGRVLDGLVEGSGWHRDPVLLPADQAARRAELNATAPMPAETLHSAFFARANQNAPVAVGDGAARGGPAPRPRDAFFAGADLDAPEVVGDGVARSGPADRPRDAFFAGADPDAPVVVGDGVGLAHGGPAAASRDAFFVRADPDASVVVGAGVGLAPADPDAPVPVGDGVAGRLRDAFFARADPGAPAVLGDGVRLTHAQLADAALRVAGALRGLGVEPGDRVGVGLPKGADQVVAVLGVLAAGGVYVPVGVDQPPARRERIVARAGLRVAITDDDWPGVETVRPAEARRAEPLAAPVHRAPEDPAYAIFTSGSTGEPKGVLVAHRAAAGTVADLAERFAMGPDDRTLAVSALDFDLSVFDVFAPLRVGGAVVVVGEDARRDPAAWARLAGEHGVTVLNCVPALAALLADHHHEPRWVLVGGDRVPVDLPGRFPGARVVALGGTTETAIHSTVFEGGGDWACLPYGVPLRGVRCRVVDPVGRDCPDWVAGELWIGGTGVALGYLEDPERTADRFVTHDGGRWYRTGDLARYRPGGVIEFLGRTDRQVKVRGHRVEPGEVENALVGVPGVRAAVVLAEGARLVAAVVGPDEEDLPARARAHAAALLPPALLPDRIVVLPALPLSANGKVDLDAVAALVRGAAPAAEPPVGPVEERVAEVWRDLLGVPAVHRRDGFFALGGDSLLAVRLPDRLAAVGVHGARLAELVARPALADFADGLRLGRPTTRDAVVPDPAARFEPFDLTEVQRAYWIGRAESFALGGVGAHWYWEFTGGEVDLPRLEAAWNAVVRRHDMLRAVVGDDGRQRVLPEVPHAVVRVVDDVRADLAHRVPDPARWPLVDLRIDATRVGIGFDLLVLDALSIVLVLTELSALCADPHAPLPPVGVTFRDYLAQAGPSPDEVDRAWAHWRAADLPPGPALPLRTDPATVVRPRFSRRELRLPAATWTALRDRARAAGVTPAVALLTAYTEVLARWSGGPDLSVVLTQFDRRPVHPDIDRVVGDFTSLLVVGSRPVPGEDLAAAARRTQDVVWRGMEHSAVSAVDVLRERGATVPVVFTSALGLPGGAAVFDTPFGSQSWGVSQTPQVWLDNQVHERDGALVVSWDAVDALFPAGVLDAAFDAYARLLRWMAAADWTGTPPAPLPVGQHAARTAVNATAGPVPRHGVHEEFFARAATRPEATALLWGEDGRLSYRDLADAALRVAGGLAARGLRPGEAVAVHLPKGPEQVVAVLGVLAAGGAYVPVGVDQPPSRRDRVLASVRLALSKSPLDGVEVVADAAPLPGPVPVDPDAVAYVIHTSGSTGVPKGVEMTHAAALNTVVDVVERYGVGASDRVLAVSALDFDLSVFDLFGLLGAGGGVVLPTEEDRRDPRAWLRLVRRHAVTVWNSVPALYDMLLAQAGDDVPALRVALVSGDWVGLDLPARSPCRLIALGGATEAAIWSNAFDTADLEPDWRSVPYGFPLRNQEFRVVDGRGRDCPDWVAGELWIGGAGVALGYRGDPERTAERFVTHDGGRWYRTGDLGRYRPGGVLEFLGRADGQVKIGGHRVELGEVEAALRAHPEVDEAVALAVGERTARRLAVAVVGRVPDDLRAFLASLLPAYLLPDRVLAVDSVPLTGTGKVDRAALAVLLEATPADAGEPPTGEWEERVALVWREVLPAREFGRHSGFFAVGGDSLLATRVVDGLRRGFHVDLTLRELLDAPTVAGLAALLADRIGDGVEEGVL